MTKSERAHAIIQLMNKLLIVVAGVAAAGVITGAGVLVNDRYTEYKTNQQKIQQANVAAEDVKVANVRHEDKLVYDKLASAFEQLHVECEKGTAAYVQLAPATKTKTPAPNCGAVVPKP